MLFDTKYDEKNKKNSTRVEYFIQHPNFCRYLLKFFTLPYIYSIKETELNDLYIKYIEYLMYYSGYLHSTSTYDLNCQILINHHPQERTYQMYM